MKSLRCIKAIYFSATERTKSVVTGIAESISKEENIPVESIDFTLPENHEEKIICSEEDLAIIGLPTYAGRIPNKVLPWVQNLIYGENTPAIAVVTFGNRDYNSSLTELMEELKKNHFQVFAGAAIACEHSFSKEIGKARPDKEDQEKINQFVENCLAILKTWDEAKEYPVPVIPGREEVKPYYQPLGIDGQPARFLKAKPVTDMDLCDFCGICASVCPMGSIDKTEPMVVNGICIKCQACIKKCPHHAKSFVDEAFLSHVAMLKENYKRRKEPEFYYTKKE